MKTNRIIMLTLAGLWLVATSAMAAITATSDDFQDSLNTMPDWVDVGETATSFSRDGNADNHDWYDGDDLTYITNYAVGMEITGDGLLGDGGLFLNTQNAIVGDEALGLTIGGTMESNRVITFKGNLYNDRTSYTDVNLQLWNLTDSTLLSESGPTRVFNYNNIAYNTVDFNISYATQDTDQGDQLQIRFREAANNTARDVYVDNFSLTSTAPLAPILYAYEGFDTAATNGTRAETVGVTGFGFLKHTNTYYLMNIYDGLSYQDSNENVLDVTGKSGGMTNLLGGTQNMQLLLDNAISNTDTGVVYMSFLHQIDSANSWGMGAGLYNTIGPVSGNPGAAVAAWRSTSSNFGIYSGDGINERLGPDSTPASNLLMFVVAKLDLDTGTMTAWINPTNLANVSASATWTMSGTAASGGFFDMNLFSFSRKNGSAKIDEIRIGNTLAVVVPISPFLEGYDAFADQYGLTQGKTGNDDSDILNNFGEYVFGGDPTNGNNIGTQPVFDSGSGDYIFSIIGDDTLQYSVLTNLNLVSGSWGTHDGPTAISDNDGSLHAFTNSVGTSASELFIKLLVE